MRENPIGFRVQRLNHSAIMTLYPIWLKKSNSNPKYNSKLSLGSMLNKSNLHEDPKIKAPDLSTKVSIRVT